MSLMKSIMYRIGHCHSALLGASSTRYLLLMVSLILILAIVGVTTGSAFRSVHASTPLSTRTPTATRTPNLAVTQTVDGLWFATALAQTLTALPTTMSSLQPPATVTAQALETQLAVELQLIFFQKTATAEALTATATPSGANTPAVVIATPLPTPTILPSPTVRARATNTPTTILRPSPTPAPNIEVLAPKLNVRLGPGTQYAATGLIEAGEKYFVSGRISDCAWLQIVLDEGGEGWVSGSATLVRLNVACSAIPLSGDSDSRSSSTVVALPTATSRPAEATPTRQPLTNTPTLQAPPTTTPVADSGGPRSVTILSPVDGQNTLSPVNFSWRSDVPLAPGQEFEIVFWNAVTETEQQGRGWVRSSTETEVRIDPSRQAPGSYRWGIYVVIPNPYQRIRYLGAGYQFVVPGESGNTDSGGGAVPEDPTDSK